MSDSIASLQQHGVVDGRLDPTITSAVLGSMTERFPEMWLTEDQLECAFDDGVDHLTVLFVNALRLERSVDDPEDAI